MAIANPRIHIICGICGNKDMMQFRIGTDLDDDKDEKYLTVDISCKNCSSLTGLDELMPEEKVDQELRKKINK